MAKLPRLYFWASNPRIFGPPWGGTMLVIENLKVISVGNRKDIMGWAIGLPWPKVRESIKRRKFKLKRMKKPGEPKGTTKPWWKVFKRKKELTPGKLKEQADNGKKDS